MRLLFAALICLLIACTAAAMPPSVNHTDNYTIILTYGQTPHHIGYQAAGNVTGWNWWDSGSGMQQQNLILAMVLDKTAHPVSGLSQPSFSLSQTRFRAGLSTYSWKADEDGIGNYSSDMDIWHWIDLDLTGHSNPELTFYTWYRMTLGDFGYVKISTDAGKTWTELANYTGYQTGVPVQKTFDLSDYEGEDTILAFNFVSDSIGTDEGWYIDDIEVVADGVIVPIFEWRLFGKTIFEDSAQSVPPELIVDVTYPTYASTGHETIKLQEYSKGLYGGVFHYASNDTYSGTYDIDFTNMVNNTDPASVSAAFDTTLWGCQAQGCHDASSPTTEPATRTLCEIIHPDKVTSSTATDCMTMCHTPSASQFLRATPVHLHEIIYGHLGGFIFGKEGWIEIFNDTDTNTNVQMYRKTSISRPLVQGAFDQPSHVTKAGCAECHTTFLHDRTGSASHRLAQNTLHGTDITYGVHSGVSCEKCHGSLAYPAFTGEYSIYGTIGDYVPEFMCYEESTDTYIINVTDASDINVTVTADNEFLLSLVGPIDNTNGLQDLNGSDPWRGTYTLPSIDGRASFRTGGKICYPAGDHLNVVTFDAPPDTGKWIVRILARYSGRINYTVASENHQIAHKPIIHIPWRCSECHQESPPSGCEGAETDLNIPDWDNRGLAYTHTDVDSDGSDDVTCRACHNALHDIGILDCVNCHRQPPGGHESIFSNFSNYLAAAYTDCLSCHHDPHNEPEHAAGGDCADCHLSGGENATGSIPIIDRDGFLGSVHFNITGDFDASNQTAISRVCWGCHNDYEGQLTDPRHFTKKPDCEDCHTDPDSWNKAYLTPPQAVEHQPAGIDVITAVNCMVCHNKSLVAGMPPGENINNPTSRNFISHYGKKRTDIIVDNGAASDCAYCHRDGGNEFGEVFADPGKADITHGVDCAACHGYGRIHEDVFTPPMVALGDNSLCLSCHNIGANFNRGIHRDIHCTDCHTPLSVSSGLIPHQEVKVFTPHECTVCHGVTPRYGAPPVIEHTNTAMEVHVEPECIVCHDKPEMLLASGKSDRGEVSHYGKPRTDIIVDDGAASDCSYCHVGGGNEFGDVFADPGKADITHGVDCTACHGYGRIHDDVFTVPVMESGNNEFCLDCHDNDVGGFEVRRAVFNAGIHAGANCTDCHTPLPPSTGIVEHPGTTPHECEVCHVETPVYGAPQAMQHTSTATKIRVGLECMGCHNKSEMILSYDHDLESEAAEVSHYGRPRYDMIVDNGTASDCAYCHRDGGHEFNDTFADPDNANIEHGVDCAACHGEGRIHDDVFGGTIYYLKYYFNFTASTGDINFAINNTPPDAIGVRFDLNWSGSDFDLIVVRPDAYDEDGVNMSEYADSHYGISEWNITGDGAEVRFNETMVLNGTVVSDTYEFVSVDDPESGAWYAYAIALDADDTAVTIVINWTCEPPAGIERGRCMECHDSQKELMTSYLINGSVVVSGMHGNLNDADSESDINRACWACHWTGAAPTIHADRDAYTPKQCEECHGATTSLFSAPQAIQHTSNATVIPVEPECMGCHNKSEMILMHGTDAGGDAAEVSHYGRKRTDIIVDSGAASDCAYCHRDGGNEFGEVFADPGKADITHGVDCTACHGYGRIHDDVFTVPVMEPGNNEFCLDCHDDGVAGFEVRRAVFNAGIHAGANCTDCHTPLPPSTGIVEHPGTTPHECEVCHVTTPVYGAPQAMQHTSTATKIRVGLECMGCHNKSEMILSYDHDLESEAAKVSHYGRPRYDMIVDGGNASDCSYCHRNGGNEFNDTFVDPDNANIEHGVDCVVCHATPGGRMRIHDESITSVGAMETGNNTLCFVCHADPAIMSGNNSDYLIDEEDYSSRGHNDASCSDCHLPLPFEVRGTIEMGQTIDTPVPVQNNTGSVNLTILWLGSELDLVVIDPTGREINLSVVSTDARITYSENLTGGEGAYLYRRYTIQKPISGIWTVRTCAVDVTGCETFFTTAESLAHFVEVPVSCEECHVTQVWCTYKHWGVSETSPTCDQYTCHVSKKAADARPILEHIPRSAKSNASEVYTDASCIECHKNEIGKTAGNMNNYDAATAHYLQAQVFDTSDCLACHENADLGRKWGNAPEPRNITRYAHVGDDNDIDTTIVTGEVWKLKNGYEITVGPISSSGKSVRINLTHEGVPVKSEVVRIGRVFEYEIRKDWIKSKSNANDPLTGTKHETSEHRISEESKYTTIVDLKIADIASGGMRGVVTFEGLILDSRIHVETENEDCYTCHIDEYRYAADDGDDYIILRTTGADDETDDSDDMTIGRLAINFTEHEQKIMHTRSEWDLGYGYLIRIAEVDLVGRKARVELSRDGTIIESEVVPEGGMFRYNTTISDQEGHTISDVTVFEMRIAKVFR